MGVGLFAPEGFSSLETSYETMKGEKDQIIGIFKMVIMKNVLEPIQIPIRNHIVQLNHFQMLGVRYKYNYLV